MKIDLTFEGWLQDVEIDTVYDVANGEDIDTSNMSGQELIEGLNEGIYSINLIECIKKSKDTNMDLRDFEISK